MSYKQKNTRENNKPDRIISHDQINRFGARLKIAMNGISNNAFAKQCGWSEKVIRNYINGLTFPSIDRLVVIANVSGRSVNWLISGEEEKNNSSNNPSMESRDDSVDKTQPTDRQRQTWYEVLERMTPVEREKIMEHIFRFGIRALFDSKNIKEKSCCEEEYQLSRRGIAAGKLFDSLNDEQRERFFEEFSNKKQDELDQCNDHKSVSGGG